MVGDIEGDTEDEALGRRLFDGKGVGDEDGCMHVMMKNRTC